MLHIFEHIRVASPVSHRSLAIFPLTVDPIRPVDYILADKAISDGKVLVGEVDQEGVVAEVLVNNPSNQCVLFVDGQILCGARQNRVVNSSTLVPAHAIVRLPVSCVEQGRWRSTSSSFTSSDTMTSSSLRSTLKSSVGASLVRRRKHRSDQNAVWRQVQRQQRAFDVQSDTMSHCDTYIAKLRDVAEFGKNLRYLAGCCGMALALGQRVVSLDLFDRPETCEELWIKFVSGVSLDALEQGDLAPRADVEDVRDLIRYASRASWQNVPAAGAGQEFYARHGPIHCSLLTLESHLVHFSIVVS